MRQILKAGAICVALMPGVATACAILAPFEVGSLSKADIILLGEVIGFKMVHEAPGAALVTLRVTEAIKGTAAEEVVLIWNEGLAMGPYEPRARGMMVIGAMATGRQPDPVHYDHRPDLPMIVQPYCGDVWMQPATPTLLAEVRVLLAP